MKKNVKELFPKWVNDNNEYLMCMTDDIDSLFTSRILERVKGYKINYFYDFKSIQSIHDLSHLSKTKDDVVFIDMATRIGKNFDNHVTLLKHGDQANPLSANLNSIRGISRDTYFHKYAFSTLLTVISYYDVFDYSKLSDEQKMILWAIDSAYLGHFSYYENDRNAHKKYIELLELEPITDVLQKYTKQDFINIIKKYKLNEKIYLSDYKLHSGIALEELQSLFCAFNLALPQDEFKKGYMFNKRGGATAYLCDNNFLNSCFTYALTGKNYLSYTQK
ncbi:hypothetical protein BTR22_05260 [Alkalihalophilus pseudofirmus]|nr:hypothetical protein BTR22_05260 [Alkalihalophilus pseudofirmus]